MGELNMFDGIASTFFKMLVSLWDLIKYFVYAFCGVLAVIFILVLLQFFYRIVIKGDRLRKRTVKLPRPKYSKPKSWIYRLFIEFPKRFVLDRITADPDGFGFYGIHIFAGEQGSGKTVAMVHRILQLREQYPACRVSSNFSLDFQDNKIESWEEILQNNNGSKGQLIVLDEAQNWFNSLESKDIPIELISEICQQRKQRKAIIGTTQVFTRIAKPLREQITLLYKPLTILHCITIVRVYKVELKDDGTTDNLKLRRVYWFVHDDYLRECYDTYEKVERLNKKGYKPRSEQISSYNDILIKLNENA